MVPMKCDPAKVSPCLEKTFTANGNLTYVLLHHLHDELYCPLMMHTACLPQAFSTDVLKFVRQSLVPTWRRNDNVTGLGT